MHGECRFLGEKAGTSANLRRLARALLRHRAATPVNPGLRALVRRGRWGYLNFPGEAAYELYLSWLLALLRWHHRHQAEVSPW